MDVSHVYNMCQVFLGNHEYILQNAYIFNWESDIFALSKSKYAVEIEVKVSKSDFLADFKKIEKHLLLKNRSKKWIMCDKRVYEGAQWFYKYCTFKYKEVKKCIPNRFYYAAPVGILKLSDIPDYAGFIEVYNDGRQFEIIKKAPLLHKEVNDLKKELLSKMYHRRNKALNDIRYNPYYIRSETLEDAKETINYLLGKIEKTKKGLL